MKRLACLAIAFLLTLVLPGSAEEKALRGVALVIGQSEYENLAPLANPGQDAKAIEDLLEDLGFDVTGVTDRNAKKLQRDLERFAEDAEGADAAIIYYSGHGIEAGGENWLVPVDANLEALEDVQDNLVPLSGVLDELRAKVPLTIFLIDACRSNPFPPGSVARKQGEKVEMSGAGLGTPRGFATIEEGATDTVGTIIGFAAEPGLPALDGEPGGNSPYAAAILRHLSAMTGEEFGLVMRMVTEEVYLKTGTRQRPWVNEITAEATLLRFARAIAGGRGRRHHRRAPQAAADDLGPSRPGAQARREDWLRLIRCRSIRSMACWRPLARPASETTLRRLMRR